MEELLSAAASVAGGASEEPYRAIFNATTDALMLRDAEFRIVDINPAWEAMSGYTRAEVVGLNRSIFNDASRRPERIALHRRALAGEHIRFEVRGRSKDGSREFLREVRLLPIQFRGKPHVLQIGTDITERKSTEERLRASEEQYRAIFNATTDALVLRDAAFRIVDVNAAYEAISGRSREAVVGLKELTLTRALPVSERMRLHDEAIAGRPVHFETDSERPDGAKMVVEVRGVPMTYRGEPHVLYMGRDITEQRRAEREQRASWEQYRAIFDAAADSFVLRDAEFRIVDVNLAYEAMSGRPRAEALGRRDVTMSDPALTARIKSMHERALAGEQVSWEARARRKNGDSFTIEVRGLPIRHQGRPHVLYIGRDISARKRDESEREQLEAQLRQAQKMEAIGHLTGGIAHDFNNILQGILGNLSLGAERQAELRDARLGRYLERARHSAQRARELIGQMLTFSRGQRGERRPVDLPDLVRDACKLLRSTLPSTIELHQSMERDVPVLRLDPVQVEQVVLNLCINARDAMGGHGAIRVGVRATARIAGVCASCRQKFDGCFVELYVRDNGPGIPAEVMDRMFEPFYSTKAVGQGSGMGLSLAHGIVHEHGGHILVDSLRNDRTKFRVLLEAPPVDAGEAAPEAGERTVPPRTRVRLSGRVLVVDDEESIREFMTDLLGGWGLEVTAMGDGAAARDAVAAEPGRFDLVITDHTMPQVTGLALAHELARVRPGLPVFLFTAYGENLTAEDLREAGIAQMVRKPIEPAQFFPLLAAHLSAA